MKREKEKKNGLICTLIDGKCGARSSVYTGPIGTKIGPDLFFCNNSTDPGCQELPVGSNGLCKLSHYSNLQSDYSSVLHGGVGLRALREHMEMMRAVLPRKFFFFFFF